MAELLQDAQPFAGGIAAEPSATSAKPAAARTWPIEGVALTTITLMVLLANLPFWHSALTGRSITDPVTWRFLATTAVMLVGLHAVPVLLLATRHTLRPLLALLLLSSLVALHMMQQYGVVLDPPMLRNALRTDWHEADELITPALLANVGAALLISLALWRLPLRRRSLRRAMAVRALTLAGVTLATLAALLLGFQDFSSLMRNQKELRYRITPGNAIYSAGRVMATDLRGAHQKPEPLRAIQRAAIPAGQRPRLLVMVVGETARAMNFSLNGYPRETNPELARLPIVNFPQTTACGTSTEVSLPCMFSPYGRADYDEDRIHNDESLVQLLARAGMRVVWLDNQSGCKGVCVGVDTRDVSQGSDPAVCPDGRCFDAALLKGLQQVIAEGDKTLPLRDTVVVLHQLGNHGPSYHKRYPPSYARFAPACTRSELRECSRDEIVNAYDNAILYTDHLLAETVTLLQQQQGRYDVGLMYASDHGESLGEKGLYLHGMPQAIAPREQLAVPMVWWFGGDGALGWNGLDAACLRARAGKAAHHDNLFHSVLGLMDTKTSHYSVDRDLISPCRSPL